jgi:hypothetical protein
VPGWIDRGAEITGNYPSFANEIMSPHKKIDPVMAMADFYLCELLSLGTAPVAAAALAYQSELVERCDAAFLAYSIGAIGGELRHGYGTRDHMPSGRQSAWDYFYALSQATDPALLARDALQAFREDGWDGGYGGYAWANCAEVLAMRLEGTFSPKLFVDRVFSLQHNGGSFLNKVAWTNKNDSQWSTSHMVSVGNAHHSAGYKTPTQIWYVSELLGVASDRVRSIFYAHAMSHDGAREAWANYILSIDVGYYIGAAHMERIVALVDSYDAARWVVEEEAKPVTTADIYALRIRCQSRVAMAIRDKRNAKSNQDHIVSVVAYRNTQRALLTIAGMWHGAGNYTWGGTFRTHAELGRLAG